MKRKINTTITAALAVILAVMSLCACSQSSSGGDHAVKRDSETKATAAAATPTAKPAEQVRLIYSDFDHEGTMPEITFTDDLDDDGTEETITLNTAPDELNDDEYTVDVRVASTNSTSFLQTMEGYGISAVYLLDLDTSDNSKEIAVIMMHYSEDPALEIFRWNGELSHMIFETYDYKDELYQDDMLWLGYVSSYPFIINNDGTFTLQTQTSSRGMWDVYTYYKVDERGYIVEVSKESYEVVDIDQEFSTDDKGFAVVEQSITGRGFDLDVGDEITILRDDGNNNILIQKSTGESGWFKMNGYDDSVLYKVSDLFILAG